MKKRYLSLLLAFTMIVSLLIPVSALADNYAVSDASAVDGSSDASGDASLNICGENAYWSFEDGVLTISGTGAMYDYEINEEEGIVCTPWADENENITSVVIEEGITGTSPYAFALMQNLKSVSLPDGLVSIGEGSFGASGIESIEIPESVESIGILALAECPNLSCVYIPEGVTSIGDYAFEGCSNLSCVYIPASVTSIGKNIFNRCEALTELHYGGTMAQWSAIEIEENNEILFSLDIIYSDDNTGDEELDASGTCGENTTWTLKDGVLTISGTGAMYDPEELTQVPWADYLSEITAVVVEEGITEVSTAAFYNATALESVSLPDGLTVIGAKAFVACTSLETIEFPDSVTEINHMAFANCTALNSIVFPENLKVISLAAFFGCSSLSEITIPASIEQMFFDAFDECTSLDEVYFEGTMQQWKDAYVVWTDRDVRLAHIRIICSDGTIGGEPDCRISVSSEEAKAGEEVTVSIILEDNPGIMAMILGIDYDETKLELLEVEDGIFTGWMYSGTAVWLGDADNSDNGVILKLKFKVLEDTEDGDVAISVEVSKGNIANYDEEVLFPELVSGKITVYSIAPGDFNGDGEINALDLVRFKKYLSSDNVELAVSGDLNGDGNVNAIDLVRMHKFLSGAEVELH